MSKLKLLSALATLPLLVLTMGAGTATTTTVTKLSVTPKVVQVARDLCLQESASSAVSFGSVSSYSCGVGEGTVTIWNLAPRYVGMPVLVEISPSSDAGGYVNDYTTKQPVARGVKSGTPDVLDIKVSGGKLAKVSGVIGASDTDISTSTSNWNGTASVSGGGVTTQQLAALAPPQISGLTASLTAPASTGSSSRELFQSFLWYPPASGGTLSWSFAGAQGQPIIIPPATELPVGWRTVAAGGLAAQPTIGASWGLFAESVAQASRWLSADHASGYTLFAGHNGANFSTQKVSLSLAGTTLSWNDPKPGQSITANTSYTDVVPVRSVGNTLVYNDPPTIMSTGDANPVDGLGVTLLHKTRRNTTVVNITPYGTESATLTLASKPTANTGHWVPVLVRMTHTGVGLGVAGQKVKVSLGEHTPGAKLKYSTAILSKSGTFQDFVYTGSAPGVIVIAGKAQGLTASAQIHVATPFPWWILLVVLAIVIMLLILWIYRRRHYRAQNKE